MLSTNRCALHEKPGSPVPAKLGSPSFQTENYGRRGIYIALPDIRAFTALQIHSS